jgi:LmbE family N-acetylglucosaminyl deacetylase
MIPMSVHTNSKKEILTLKDRVLVMAPHPDDEVLGCGGIIQRAIKMGLPVHVLFLTYGDANQWSFIVHNKWPVVIPEDVIAMGLVRHDEACAAAKVLGLSLDDLTFLGYPDFGTLNMLCAHWGDNPPYKSLLTRATAVPYNNALRPGALYKGEEVLHDLKTVLRQFNPTKIFLSHAADHNRDHRALYAFTRAALWELKTEHAELYPYLAHYHNWPTPKGYYPAQPLTPPAPCGQEISFTKYPLNSFEVDRNRTALEKHKTQYASNTEMLSSFIRANELFGDFPNIVLNSCSPSVEIEHHLRSPELMNTEAFNVVGAHLHIVGLQNDNLSVSIELSGLLAEEIEASVHCFGYRSDTLFAELPKLNIRTGIFDHAVFDQTHMLPPNTVHVSRKGKKIMIHIPYTVLGNPERILVGARLYMAELPIDWVPWRVVELVHQ